MKERKTRLAKCHLSQHQQPMQARGNEVHLPAFDALWMITVSSELQ